MAREVKRDTLGDMKLRAQQSIRTF
jgi:hypothetical protein